MTGPPDAVFDALGDATRRRLFAAVADAGPSTATELATLVPVSRQAVTKHLAVLAAAGLVTGRREGRERRYAAAPDGLDEARAWLDDVGRRWDDRLAALRGRVTEARPRGAPLDRPSSTGGSDGAR